MRAGRTRNRVRAHVLALRTPYGLVSARYLLPRLSESQRVHLRLLALGGPTGLGRAASTALDVWHWLRWVTFGGWRTAIRAVRARYRPVEVEFGVSRWRQLTAVLVMTIIHGIPPADYYRLQLYRHRRRGAFWDYVFGNETDAFHRWRDGKRDTASARALLTDKVEWARATSALGLDVVDTLAVVPRGTEPSAFVDALERAGHPGPVVCKPRAGSGARGVFRAMLGPDGLQASTLSGRRYSGAESVDLVTRRLAVAEYLVQPYIATDSAFGDLAACADEALTVRLITERHCGVARLSCAFVEVPRRTGDSMSFTPLAVDIETGVIGPAAAQPLTAVTVDDVDACRALARDAAGRSIPGWTRYVDAARRAHDGVADLYSVAWDFIIGADGPQLLEGNASWGTAVPQLIQGPLLAERTNR